MSSKASFALEQMTLLKDGGLSYICGPTTAGLVWPNMISDMLLSRMLSNDRFRRVVVIAVDRSPLEVMQAAGVGIGSRESARVSKGPAVNGGREPSSKLAVVDAIGITTGKCSLSDVLMQVQIQTAANIPKGGIHTSNAAGQAQGQEQEQEEEEEQGALVAVVVTSVSALHLSVGQYATRMFMSNLVALMSSGDGAAARPNVEMDRGSSGSSRGVILGVLHKNLHSAREIVACYRARADVFCEVVPNAGQMSPVVAAEVLSVRRSASGKVTEGSDLFALQDSQSLQMQMEATRGQSDARGLFLGRDPSATLKAKGWRPAALVLLPKCAAPTDHSEDTYAEDATADGHGHDRDRDRERSKGAEEVESVFGRAEPGSGTDSHPKSKTDAKASALQQAAAAHASAKVQQRLITFASTDPEFDEDSDPDGDLDL
jgi:hypothetical protein